MVFSDPIFTRTKFNELRRNGRWKNNDMLSGGLDKNDYNNKVG